MKLNFSSLKVKVSMIIITLGVFWLAISAYLSYQFTDQDNKEHYKDKAMLVWGHVLANLEEGMANKKHEWVLRTLDYYRGSKEIKELRVFGPEGKEAFYRVEGPGEPRVVRVLKTGRPITFRKVADACDVLTYVFPVRSKPACQSCHGKDREVLGAVMLSHSLAEMKADVAAENRRYAVLFVFTLIAFSATAMVISKRLFLSPLERLWKGTEAIENGDLKYRVPVKAKDEIGDLTRSFNRMAERLQHSFDEKERFMKEIWALAFTSDILSVAPLSDKVYEGICQALIKNFDLKSVWLGHLVSEDRDIVPLLQCKLEKDGSVITRGDDCDSPFDTHLISMTLGAIKDNTPRVLNSVDRNPEHEALKAEAAAKGYSSAMLLPLISTKGRTLGVIVLCSIDPEYFSDQRTKLFQVFANQAAVVIENSLLIEDLGDTNRQLGEQALLASRSEKEWQKSFDSVTDLICIIDRGFRILRANQAFRENFGLSEDELKSRTCHDLLGTCSRDYCPHLESIRKKTPVTQELHDAKTGKILQLSFFPYEFPEGDFSGSILVAKDITKFKEDEMRLIMNERLAALGQMASGIAHEINNPLATIAACTEGLLSRLEKEKIGSLLFESYLKMIEEETLRCKKITESMLSFVKKTPDVSGEVRVNDVVEKTVELISFLGRLKDVEIVRRYGEDMPAIRGNEGELKQVFLSILTNALDAMGEKGTIVLETGVVEGPTARSASAPYPSPPVGEGRGEGGFIYVKISDTGPGIPATIIKRIFDPFYTTKSGHGGTGLGLAIADRIVRENGGKIEAASEEGKGATFTILLPL
jgi:two-component system NtrC family sensor kinase